MLQCWTTLAALVEDQHNNSKTSIMSTVTLCSITALFGIFLKTNKHQKCILETFMEGPGELLLAPRSDGFLAIQRVFAIHLWNTTFACYYLYNKT